jgi:hypothetical protein
LYATVRRLCPTTVGPGSKSVESIWLVKSKRSAQIEGSSQALVNIDRPLESLGGIAYD